MSPKRMAPTSADPTGARVVRFAAGTLAVSAAFWAAGAASEVSLLTPHLPLSALMFVGPTVGLVAAVGPRCAWDAFRAPFRRLRRELPHAVAWLPVMPLVVLAAARPTWSGPGQDALPITSALLLSAGFLVSSLLEQLGWMWFAGQTLAPRLGALGAGVVSGSFWAGVHVIPWFQAGRTLEWVIGQSLFSVVFLCVIVEAYLRQRSLLTAVALQASFDTTWIAVASVGGTYDPWATALATAALLVAVHVMRAHRSGATQTRRGPDDPH